MSSRPVHAVIVAYHAPGTLDRCLAALEHAIPVTVIDNSSSGDVAAVAGRHRAVYIDPGRNVGFASGVNLALAHLDSEDGDVLLVNPDAVITPGAVRALARFMHRETDARVATVSPRLVDPRGREQRVQWPFPSPVRMCAEAIGLGRLPARRHFVVGAVVLLRRDAIEDVGAFDERFFLYAEEADWQRRALARGWSSAVCGEAVAEHLGAAASSDGSVREARFHAAQELYVRKWYGTGGWRAYRAAACAGAGARALVLSGEGRRRAAQRMSLYLHGPVRCAPEGADWS